jgi:hypothetical protein
MRLMPPKSAYGFQYGNSRKAAGEGESQQLRELLGRWGVIQVAGSVDLQLRWPAASGQIVDRTCWETRTGVGRWSMGVDKYPSPTILGSGKVFIYAPYQRFIFSVRA